MRLQRILWIALVLPSFFVGACGSSSQPRILVVVNDQSPISMAIGRYYADRRHIPKERVVSLSIPLKDPTLERAVHETISQGSFNRYVRLPLEEYLTHHGLIDSIDIIVTTKGIPLRVSGTKGPLETWLRDVTQASVDAELSLLFSESIGSAGVVEATNPYFASNLPFRTFRERNRTVPLRYMVARLTGYQDRIDAETGVPVDIKRMIDDAVEPVDEETKNGVFVLDTDPSQEGGLDAANFSLLGTTMASLQSLGEQVEFDQTRRFVSDVPNIQGYSSWGSNDRQDPGGPCYGLINDKQYPGGFARRSVAVTLVSTNARSFTHPTNYGQSLIADLLRLGISGAAGHTWEPVLAGVPRPYIFLYDYAKGVPAIEAYYRSLAYLGWMNVYVGDPLMTVPRPASQKSGDRDGDGTPDNTDNCTLIPNPKQRDSDGDGFGNRCDADINGDGLVTTSWGKIYPMTQRGDIEWIGLVAKNGPYDPKFDLNGDGNVDHADMIIAQLGLFLPPGPSALARPRAR